MVVLSEFTKTVIAASWRAPVVLPPMDIAPLRPRAVTAADGTYVAVAPFQRDGLVLVVARGGADGDPGAPPFHGSEVERLSQLVGATAAVLGARLGRAGRQMTLWRVRATIEDRPGFLAVLAASLALRSVNILSVQVHTTEAGAVDDFLVDAPDDDHRDRPASRRSAAGRGRDPWVALADVRGLVDEPTRVLALAARVVADRDALEEALGLLLGDCEISWRADGGSSATATPRAPCSCTTRPAACSSSTGRAGVHSGRVCAGPRAGRPVQDSHDFPEVVVCRPVLTTTSRRVASGAYM